MTFYVTRIKRKSKGSLSGKSRPYFVLDGKRRSLLSAVGTSVLINENALPETAENFFFVFFSFFKFIFKSAHFGNILFHEEGVGCYADEI